MTPRHAAGARDRVRVGLLWHSVNSANLGVGALTVGNIAIARQAAAEAGLTPTFLILGYFDQGAPVYVTDPDVEMVAINGRAMLPGGAYAKAMSRVDCVLDIGAGDSFTDIYPAKRFAYMWLTKAVAIAKGRPLLLSPQTIGPFSREPFTGLAAWAMDRADLVVTRDPLSFEVTRRMAPRARVLQAVDVAFALPFERRTRTADGTTEVGLNVSGLLFNGGYTGANEFGMQVDYAAYTRQLIERLLARPKTSVQLVCHVNSDDVPQDDDRRVADRLAAEYPDVVRAPDFVSPSAAKSYISGLDFLVAGRMHACIAAFSSGVPVVPVAYSRKFAGLFEGVLRYPHLVPVSGLDTSAAVDFTLARLDDRETLKADITRGSAEVEGLLAGYRKELVRLFRQSAQPS